MDHIMTVGQAQQIIDKLDAVMLRLDGLSGTDKPMDVAEAAEWFGMSEDRVRTLCRTGQLKAFRTGKKWQVSRNQEGGRAWSTRG